jgi:hypothetical protein
MNRPNSSWSCRRTKSTKVHTNETADVNYQAWRGRGAEVV